MHAHQYVSVCECLMLRQQQNCSYLSGQALHISVTIEAYRIIFVDCAILFQWRFIIPFIKWPGGTEVVWDINPIQPTSEWWPPCSNSVQNPRSRHSSRPCGNALLNLANPYETKKRWCRPVISVGRYCSSSGCWGHSCIGNYKPHGSHTCVDMHTRPRWHICTKRSHTLVAFAMVPSSLQVLHKNRFS